MEYVLLLINSVIIFYTKEIHIVQKKNYGMMAISANLDICKTLEYLWPTRGQRAPVGPKEPPSPPHCVAGDVIKYSH